MMFRLRLSALSSLLGHYYRVFAASWAVRRQLDAKQRPEHEVAFLPANLELIERPVHPAPNWAMRAISVLAVIALIIALVGRLDIVVNAKGKLLPNDRVKIVQSATTGVVRSIFVRDGQRVSAGELLMELDTTQAVADSDKAHAAKVDMALAVARAQALIAAQSTGRSPIVAKVTGASADEQQQAQRFADGLFHEYSDKLASAQAEQLKRQAELESTSHEIDKLRATAPIAGQQAHDYAALASGAYVARHDYLDKELSALEHEHELEAQKSHSFQLTAGIAQQASDISAIRSQFRREQLDILGKSSQQFVQNSNDETKANTRQRLLSLRSPVSGTVQQLATHTLGGVVTAAQSLMEIVPDDAIEVEATIENKDVGFIREGQDVTVKVEAFPYTRYGYLKGKVTGVSKDAVQDKKLGLAFVAHIQPTRRRMLINAKWVDLTPGMEVTAEINTGTRSVAGYFLEPMLEVANESLHER